MHLAKHVRERGAKIRVNAGEPGIIFSTGVFESLNPPTWPFYMRWIQYTLDWLVGFTVEEGALALLFLGTSERIREEEMNGQFWSPFGYLVPREKYPKFATEETAERLWEWSEDFVGKKEAEWRMKNGN